MGLSTKKHFVWFVGHSAVGKQSTIDALLERPLHKSTYIRDSSSDLQELLGIDLANGGAQIEAVPRDGNSQAQYGDRVRTNILAAASKSHCVLVKWQHHYGDICARLAKERPNDEHTVIHLLREEKEHLEGFIQKHGKTWDEDLVRTKQAFYAQRETNNNECRRYANCDNLRFMTIMIEQGHYSSTK